MKKWIVAIVIIILAWNSWLTSQLFQNKKSKENLQSNITLTSTDISKNIPQIQSYVVEVSGIYAGQQTSGSGIIYAKDDQATYIFTILNLIDDADSIVVTFDNGLSAIASVEGVDEQSGIALITCQPEFEVRPPVLSAFNKNIGDFTLLVGGKNQQDISNTVTFGYISSLNSYPLHSEDTWVNRLMWIDGHFVNHQLGSGLFNVQGELYGIVIGNSIESKFPIAMDVNDLKYIFSDLKKDGKVSRGSLGVITKSIDDLKPYEKSALNIPLSQTTGVYVVDVLANGASHGVLQKGDYITLMDGQNMADQEILYTKLYDHQSNDTVNLSFIRNGQKMDVSVVLQ